MIWFGKKATMNIANRIMIKMIKKITMIMVITLTVITMIMMTMIPQWIIMIHWSKPCFMQTACSME
jgi:hypothetical protein